jgi:hypothetical protein
MYIFLIIGKKYFFLLWILYKIIKVGSLHKVNGNKNTTPKIVIIISMMKNMNILSNYPEILYCCQ